MSIFEQYFLEDKLFVKARALACGGRRFGDSSISAVRWSGPRKLRSIQTLFRVNLVKQKIFGQFASGVDLNLKEQNMESEY